MKILIVSNMYPSSQKPYSGIFVKNQFEGLKSKLPNDWDISFFYQKRKFTNLLGSLKKYFIQVLKFFPYFFKKYDIIHLHFLSPLIYLLLLYKFFHSKTKIIITYHGSDIHNIKFNRKRNILSWLVNNFVNTNISVSKSFKEQIQYKLNVTVDYVISPGIDDTIFKNMNIKNQYDILFVGSFYEIKGIDLLISALTAIRKDYSVCFVGSGAYLDKIYDLKKSGVKIDILENLNHQELSVIYNKSKFLVAPSRNESFGLTVSEAMVCGTPCITSDIQAFNEKITDNENGLLFECNNLNSLIYKLNYALDMPNSEYNKLVDNCINEKSYSLSYVTDELIKLYKK